MHPRREGKWQIPNYCLTVVYTQLSNMSTHRYCMQANSHTCRHTHTHLQTHNWRHRGRMMKFLWREIGLVDPDELLVPQIFSTYSTCTHTHAQTHTHTHTHTHNSRDSWIGCAPLPSECKRSIDLVDLSPSDPPLSWESQPSLEMGAGRPSPID